MLLLYSASLVLVAWAQQKCIGDSSTWVGKTIDSAVIVSQSARPVFTDAFDLGQPLTIRATIDVSNVGCGCDSGIYFVSPPGKPSCEEACQPSKLCDASWPASKSGLTTYTCPELDLIEASFATLSVNIHDCENLTSGFDKGECGWQDPVTQTLSTGISPHSTDANYGYGLVAPNAIDSSKPYTMTWQLDGKGLLYVEAAQDGMTKHSKSLGYDPKQFRNAFLEFTVWGDTEIDKMAWLDGGKKCLDKYPNSQPYGKCDPWHTQWSLHVLEITKGSAPSPTPTPSPTPPQPTPGPPPTPPPTPPPAPGTAKCCYAAASCAEATTCNKQGDWCSQSEDKCNTCSGLWCPQQAIV